MLKSRSDERARTLQIFVVVGLDDEFVVANAIQIDGGFDHFDVFAEHVDHFLEERASFPLLMKASSDRQYSNGLDDEMVEHAFVRAAEFTDVFQQFGHFVHGNVDFVAILVHVEMRRAIASEAWPYLQTGFLSDEFSNQSFEIRHSAEKILRDECTNTRVVHKRIHNVQPFIYTIVTVTNREREAPY